MTSSTADTSLPPPLASTPPLNALILPLAAASLQDTQTTIPVAGTKRIYSSVFSINIEEDMRPW